MAICFAIFTIADLNSSITFLVLFSQEKPLRWKEINTHTHTHTHAHTQQNQALYIFFIYGDIIVLMTFALKGAFCRSHFFSIFFGYRDYISEAYL